VQNCSHKEDLSRSPVLLGNQNRDADGGFGHGDSVKMAGGST
jgi:hypothetical protein